MEHWKIGTNWWQRVDGVNILNVWERPDSLAILSERDTDPLGPRSGDISTEEEFNLKLNQIYEKLNQKPTERGDQTR